MISESESTKNYTPLPAHLYIKQKKSHPSFALINITAFMIAITFTSLVYFSQMRSQKQIITSQAAGEGQCGKGLLQNPQHVRGNSLINGKIIDIHNGDIIQSNSITLNWDSSVAAQSYYLLIDTNPVAPEQTDPAINGKEIVGTTYTIENLRPGSTYTIYVRAKGYDGKFGYSYPDPYNCNYSLTAEKLFSFTTK